MGLNDIDPGAGNTPNNENQILSRVVDELVLVRTVLSEPSVGSRSV